MLTSTPLPTNQTHKPNAHPYAVKTTTSGLLSRSNSSPLTAHTIKHHYVPPSPTRKRHRYSRSLESVDDVGVGEGQYPSPLPTPPSFGCAESPTYSTVRRVVAVATPQRKRADTLPSGSTTPCMSTANDSALNDNSLPSEPKEWTTDQLITYLSTSFSSSGDPEVPNTEDVLSWVQECGLTGQEWLRLTGRDLAGTSLSDAQISLVLDNSRTLRADSLRRHIWGKSDGKHSTTPSPFHSALYRNSISSVDLSASSPDAIVDIEGPISPPLTLHRSNSISESFVRRYRDLAHIRVRRRGKVKGLVETWEREVSRRGSLSGTEGSICSEGSVPGSDAGSENEVSEANDIGLEVEQAQESPETFHEEALSINGSVSPAPSMADTTLIASNPPPPYTSIHSLDEEEPSIEDLLESTGSLEGARAWEADLRMGETVKRIPIAGPAHPAIAVIKNSQSSLPFSGEGKADSVVASIPGGDKVRGKMHVVTQSFTGFSEHDPKHSDSTREIPNGDDAISHNAVPNAVSTVDVGVQVCDTLLLADCSPSDWPNHTDAVRAVEASLASTRAELEIFKARLEVLEADLLHSEANSMQPSNGSDGNMYQVEEQPHQKAVQIPTDDGQLLQQTQDETTRYTELSWRGIVHSVSTGIMTWLYPYTQPIARRGPVNRPKRRKDNLSPVRATALPALRLSSAIMFSFLLCAALLRRAGLTRWIRRP
ncbi:hypothetical protein F5141DRAFT_1209744 [Pisolithus sp. B1]|nr:hypothetical protein F5141DRAFT_1209744 [Pisolithus sp. B1]